MIRKQTLNSLFFVFVVLILAIIAKVDRDDLKQASFQENIRDTSLTASLKPALNTAKTNPIQNLAAIEEFLLIKNIPRKKSDVALPDSKSQAALVYDLDSGTELFGLNTYSLWPIASLTKLMTAVITIENVGQNKYIPITEKAWATESMAGGFRVGEVYQASDLIKAMLVVSSNDAAAAIAEFYGENNFLEAMQKKAAALGMTQTTFADSSGLSFLNQSSVYDLEKLIEYILKDHPEILAITKQTKAELLEINSGHKRVLANINFFAGREDFEGGKTGFIDASGSNLISIFNYKEHRLLIIFFGAEDRFVETESLYNWIKSSYEFN